MKILMTCFEPFGGFTSNSSYEALKRLNNLEIDIINLPVSYPDAYVVFRQLIKEPDFIILLGMAATRERISIEDRAKNLLDFKIPDNHHQIIKQRKIADEEQDILYSKVDIDKMICYLNKNEDLVYKSNDAGSYICNYIYFKVLQMFDTPSIFIHIPNYQTDEDFEKLEVFLKELINYVKGECKWKKFYF